jgi:hypothetical protein
MKVKNGNFALIISMAAVALLALSFTHTAVAQGRSTIDAGTTITVRTNETINANNSDGRVFSGVVEQNVTDRNGNIAIPRGSDVELVVRKISNNDLALDLDSVMINGQRYGIETDENVVGLQRSEGLGANQRTGKYVGGGAVLGAIIGAIAGGGKGAAIGAGAGAAAGAGAQVLTRGGHVSVPAESLLTFRLAEPLRAGVIDRGFNHNGYHYHQTYDQAASDSPAYWAGLRAGRSDAERNLPRNMQPGRWNLYQDRRDYEAGYNEGYQSLGAYNTARQKPGYYGESSGTVTIGRDKRVTWRGPENATVYVQVDNEAPKLFAAGRSGTTEAPWISDGHIYVFVLKDANGNEIARAEQDLRSPRRRPGYSR